MKLLDSLKDVNHKKICGNSEIEIKNISINSGDINEGDLFIAIKGFKFDGHDYIKEAVSRGASSLIVQREANIPPDVSQVIVDNTREVLPILCRNFYKDQ